MALFPLSPIAIVLLSCNLASPLDALPPLHMLSGCHVGLVFIASSLVTPPPLKAPARCPRHLLMHNPLVCPGLLSHHLATATASQCAGLLSPCLSSRHPLVCPTWLSRTPRRTTTSQHKLSTSDVDDPSSSLSSLSRPFVIACHAGHKPPSTFDAPIDSWLLCPLSPHLFPMNCCDLFSSRQRKIECAGRFLTAPR